jgi:hypothetical protein
LFLRRNDGVLLDTKLIIQCHAFAIVQYIQFG